MATLDALRKENALLRAKLASLEEQLAQNANNEAAFRVFEGSSGSFYNLFETIAQGVIYQDANGRITLANPAAEQILGLSLDEMQGRKSVDPRWRAVYEDGSDFPGERHPAMVALQTGWPVNDVVMGVFHPQKETYRWILVNAVPEFRAGELQPCRVCTVFTDITERKLAGQTIASLAKFPDENPNPVMRVDLNGRILYANLASATFLDYWGRETGQDVPDTFLETIKAVQQPGVAHEVEMELKDRIFSLSFVLVPETGYINIYGKDITARKLAEEQRQKSELLFRTLFELSPDAVILIDPHNPHIPSVIVDCNAAACQMNGYRREELIGQSIEIINAAPYPESERSAYLEKLRQGTLNLEVIHRRKYGTLFPVETSTTIIQVGERELVIGIDRDITERKQAEEKLREREELLSMMGRTAQVGGWEFDPITGEGLWTEEVARIHDLDPSAQTNKEIGLSFYHGESKARIVAAIQEAIERGISYDLELEIVSAAGTHKWIRTIGHPVLENGQIVKLRGSFQDVTERKQAEERLRASEEKMSSIFRVAPTGIGVVKERILVEINPRICEMTGYAKEELLGQSARVLYPTQEEFELVGREKYQQIAQNGAGVVETCWQKKNGSIISIILASTPIDPADLPKGVIFTALDITERKLAEEKLRASETRFATVFHSSPNAIAIAQLSDGKMIDVNRAWEDITGWSRAEALGQSPVELNLWVDPSEREQLKAQLAEHGVMHGFEMQMRARSGAILSLLMAAEVITIQDEPCMLSIAQDITERRQMEDELRRSNADLEQFAYVASHDLQEPLRAVTGMVQLLQKKYQGQLDARADEYIQHAVEAASRMQALISDLLTYSRVDRKGRAPEPVSAQRALDIALANLQIAIQETDAKITHAELPTVWADPSQLAQLFQNLIGNALKFRGENPLEIQVLVTKLADAFQFTVCDNGIGIEPQYYERIFLVFQRLHTRREYPGTGIGLALCKKIVERHGGRIWVESEFGQGAKFHFTLPIRSR